MTPWLALAAVAGVLLGVVGTLLAARRRRDRPERVRDRRRILFPFVGHSLSEPALDAALRIARAEDATVVPAYLVAVPRILDLATPVPKECAAAFELFEAIEQRAGQAAVPVDTRIQRGRTLRHAMRQLMAGESYDRIVVAAELDGNDGFSAEDVAWLLHNAAGEVVVLRPADQRRLAAHA
jgi:hypothetical protein